MPTPEQEYVRALSRLADDEVSMIVGLRRVLLTFAMVVIATLAISRAEAAALRRQLLPLERVMSDSSWIALESAWRTLGDALTTYGGEYAQTELEPWWELALASQLGTLSVRQIMGPNPTLDNSIETISEFARRLSHYNRAIRRLTTRAAAGIGAGELDAIDMMMLDTLRLVAESDSLLAAQSVTILKTTVVMDRLARENTLPAWLGGRFPEVFAAGRRRFENDEKFEPFGNAVLSKDLRTSVELDRVSPNYATLISHLQQVDHPHAASVRSKIRELRSAIRDHEEGAAVSVPGVGVGIPLRYISVAAVAVILTVFVLAMLATQRLIALVREVEDPTNARVTIRIAQHRVPWLCRGAVSSRAIASLIVAAPTLALIALQVFDGAAWTPASTGNVVISAAVVAATWFGTLAAARTLEELRHDKRVAEQAAS